MDGEKRNITYTDVFVFKIQAGINPGSTFIPAAPDATFHYGHLLHN